MIGAKKSKKILLTATGTIFNNTNENGHAMNLSPFRSERWNVVSSIKVPTRRRFGAWRLLRSITSSNYSTSRSARRRSSIARYIWKEPILMQSVNERSRSATLIPPSNLQLRELPSSISLGIVSMSETFKCAVRGEHPLISIRPPCLTVNLRRRDRVVPVSVLSPCAVYSISQPGGFLQIT